jgi:hypothetical protein
MTMTEFKKTIDEFRFVLTYLDLRGNLIQNYLDNLHKLYYTYKKYE